MQFHKFQIFLPILWVPYSTHHDKGNISVSYKCFISYFSIPSIRIIAFLHDCILQNFLEFWGKFATKIKIFWFMRDKRNYMGEFFNRKKGEINASFLCSHNCPFCEKMSFIKRAIHAGK